jgi:hypothetical protein
MTITGVSSGSLGSLSYFCWMLCFGVIYQLCSVCQVLVVNYVVLLVSDAFTCRVGGCVGEVGEMRDLY